MKKRIYELIDYLGLSKRAFSLSIGASDAWARNIKENIGSDKIDKILSTYPMVNKVWLIDGEGEMILENETNQAKEEASSHHINKDYKLMYEDIRQDNKELRDENKNLRETILELMHKNEALLVENVKLKASLKIQEEAINVIHS